MRRNLVTQRDPFERPRDSFKMQSRDDILISILDKCRQDLAIPRKVFEMADGLSDQTGLSLPMPVRRTERVVPLDNPGQRL